MALGPELGDPCSRPLKALEAITSLFNEARLYEQASAGEARAGSDVFPTATPTLHRYHWPLVGIEKALFPLSLQGFRDWTTGVARFCTLHAQTCNCV